MTPSHLSVWSFLLPSAATRVQTAQSARDNDLMHQQEWQRRRATHQRRVDTWITPHLQRRMAGERHPVEDFLFDYYRLGPAKLRQWHPGPEVVLEGESAREYLGSGRYQEVAGGVRLGPDAVGRVARTADFVLRLQRALLDRPAQFGCLGLHEWAMVYRAAPEQVRHSAYPLRLGPAGTDRVVETQQIRCSHHDAYRFFTEPARPLNPLRPALERRIDMEQGGCLHANMDVYKWAGKLLPAVPSELVADAFALAREIRALDMRASPYDLTSLGYRPIAIETPEGRAEYVRLQREYAEQARPLRERLVRSCERILREG